MKLQQALRSLTRPLQRRIAALVYPEGTQPADFLEPPGEAALLDPDSTAWRVFGNPVALLVGGITAVLLELAEPRVRSGVWDHTTFRERPLLRLQRTGYASMMTAFGARSRAQAMIARINAGHAKVRGLTPAGVAYHANDVELLTWVHATATFGFLQAYVRCVRDVPEADRDRFYADNQPGAKLFGVPSPPGSEREFDALFERMHPSLEPSAIVLEFIAIMGRVPLLPASLRSLQSLFVRVAVQALPAPTRQLLGLDGPQWRVGAWQWMLVRALGRMADHMTLPNLPALLAIRRLAMPPR